MRKVAKEFDFTESSQTKHCSIKGCDFLNGDLEASFLVDSRTKILRVRGKEMRVVEKKRYLPNNAICTFTDYVFDLVLIRDMEGDFPGFAVMNVHFV